MNDFHPPPQTSCLPVLVALAHAMGTIRGRVRIQKLVYLLKRLGLRELTGIEFFYHHYGPFSQAIVDGLVAGVESGAIVEDAKSLDDDRQLYEYTAPGSAPNDLRDLSTESIEIITDLVRRARSEHWRTLELACTVDFLERRDGIGRDRAVERALELKPACKPYREVALRLLQDVLPGS